jgi:superoxide reductase
MGFLYKKARTNKQFIIKPGDYMERRDFIRISAASMAASIVASAATLAETGNQQTASRDIYYTKEAPGRWAAKVATHLPAIEVEKAAGKVTVKISTAHEMNGYEHYIVKHVLLDKNYHFIDEKLFNPAQDKTAVSSYTLENYSGPVYALSMCNKHDLWLNSATV